MLSNPPKRLEYLGYRGLNFPNWFTIIPKTLLSSEVEVGVSIRLIASVFSGSARTPSLSMMCPKNLTVVLPNSHLDWLRVTCTDVNRFSTLLRRSSCSLWFFPKTRMSSIRHTTPSRPSRMRFILFRKISGALDMPNSNSLNAYRPNRVINVVRSLL